MSTEILYNTPVLESLTVGSGSYTIPANKYAHVSMSSSITFSGTNLPLARRIGYGDSATSNNNEVILIAGNTITVASSFPSVYHASDGNVGRVSGAVGYSIVYVNGVPLCPSYAGVQVCSYGTQVGDTSLSTGALGWQASIFPIPKNNLDTNLIL
jgi:hypothetical protein